ncbi:hypothetical protein GCM10011408_29200 [Dyella caseinilytica]|nr:hypothetical protein GCM10011408_29200 [Dyella caseinilytica]
MEIGLNRLVVATGRNHQVVAIALSLPAAAIGHNPLEGTGHSLPAAAIVHNHRVVGTGRNRQVAAIARRRQTTTATVRRPVRIRSKGITETMAIKPLLPRSG